MEDDKIKQLFDNFSPRLSPAEDFMDKLTKNMAAVEDVKLQISNSRRRMRRAAFAAAFAGFTAGVAACLLVLWLAPAMNENLSRSLPHFGSYSLLSRELLGYAFVACSTIGAAFATYRASVAKG